MFESFETDKHINGSDSFIKGDNYELFKKDYYSPDESTYEVFEIPKEVDVSPSMIEGIHLGKWEMENPSVFWSQHKKEGTLGSFKEIANRIPDVKDQLASGKTLDELLADPELSECASIFFVNKPKVIENDGYYEFDSNGRHRILAAREAGFDIPVEVIGRRDRSDRIERSDLDNVYTEETVIMTALPGEEPDTEEITNVSVTELQAEQEFPGEEPAEVETEVKAEIEVTQYKAIRYDDASMEVREEENDGMEL